ncbi:hypothetical protein [Bradyrhizobium erythrophlei]|uniref:hypothetical protein n=1 Tax=Bradyrhizobium erythrophlei TaxID=1437360 RepID=UPI0012AB9908|nr:hypothetical protein [Bradyrhizobium erythrophlei]
MTEESAEDQPAGEAYSPDELRALIAAFTPLDWLRLRKAAMYFSKRCRLEWGELQNEALVRSLEGRRKCPRNVAVTTFLGNAIRSIASEADGTNGHVHLSEKLEAQQSGPSGLTDLTKPADPAASTMDAQKMIAEAISAFDGDEKSEMLFEGTIDGIEGQELRELLQLSQKEFDTKRRFVRRRLNDYAERNPNVR